MAADKYTQVARDAEEFADARAVVLAACSRLMLPNTTMEQVRNDPITYAINCLVANALAKERQTVLIVARKALERVRNGYCDCPEFVKFDDLSLHGKTCPRRIAHDALAKIGDKR